MAASAVILGAFLAGCGSSKAASSGKNTASVTVALDYYANVANYAGFYVAEKNGYYAAAGLKVNIEPYTTTAPETLVAAGTAEFGTDNQATVELSQAAAAPLTSVAALAQHIEDRLAVAIKDTNKIKTPADLCGDTYGGFGSPIEVVLNAEIIKDAGGGNCAYHYVTLGSQAYAELTSGQVDWSQPYVTDDAFWAQLAGDPWKLFDPTDYGFPDTYGSVLFANNGYLKNNPAVARKFVEATVQGYEWAAKHPDQAVALQAASGVGSMNIKNQDATAELLAKTFWLDPNGKVEPQTAARWSGLTQVLTQYKVLKTAGGKTIATTPSSSTWFTNAYLAGGS